MTLTPLAIISILPLLFYLVDGHYEKNTVKGAYMILGFISLMALVIIATKIFGWYIVCFVPLFFIILMFYKIAKSK